MASTAQQAVVSGIQGRGYSAAAAAAESAVGSARLPSLL
jgi:hypothetical protein